MMRDCQGGLCALAYTTPQSRSISLVLQAESGGNEKSMYEGWNRSLRQVVNAVSVKFLNEPGIERTTP